MTSAGTRRPARASRSSCRSARPYTAASTARPSSQPSSTPRLLRHANAIGPPRKRRCGAAARVARRAAPPPVSRRARSTTASAAEQHRDDDQRDQRPRFGVAVRASARRSSRAGSASAPRSGRRCCCRPSAGRRRGPARPRRVPAARRRTSTSWDVTAATPTNVAATPARPTPSSTDPETDVPPTASIVGRDGADHEQQGGAASTDERGDRRGRRAHRPGEQQLGALEVLLAAQQPARGEDGPHREDELDDPAAVPDGEPAGRVEGDGDALHHPDRRVVLEHRELRRRHAVRVGGAVADHLDAVVRAMPSASAAVRATRQPDPQPVTARRGRAARRACAALPSTVGASAVTTAGAAARAVSRSGRWRTSRAARLMASRLPRPRAAPRAPCAAATAVPLRGARLVVGEEDLLEGRRVALQPQRSRRR